MLQQIPDEDQIATIEEFCFLNGFNVNSIQMYARLKICNVIFTSEVYKRQKTRQNQYIYIGMTLNLD